MAQANGSIAILLRMRIGMPLHYFKLNLVSQYSHIPSAADHKEVGWFLPSQTRD